MDSIYKCLNCGRIWRSGEIMVVCPVCTSKSIRVKRGVYVGEVEARLSAKRKDILN